MSSIAAISVLKPILIVGALAAVGMGGYNLATTGCVLGSCDAPEQGATLTSVSDVDASAPSCDSRVNEGDAAPTQLVDFEGETTKAECCSDAMKAACEVMGECPPSMKDQCEDDSDCSMGAATATVNSVSEDTSEASDCSEGAAKAEGCSDAMKAACEVMGECPPSMKEQCEDDSDCSTGAAKVNMVSKDCGEAGEASDCSMGAAKAALVAETNEEQSTSDCQKACESKAEAEQTADAEKVETETSEG